MPPDPDPREHCGVPTHHGMGRAIGARSLLGPINHSSMVQRSTMMDIWGRMAPMVTSLDTTLADFIPDTFTAIQTPMT